MSYHQTIYNLLRQAGMTEAGALGVLGNWEWESGCEPYRKENDNASFRTISKDYTERIQNGSITKEQFATGKVGTGYGIAQWTYQSRQAEFYDFWKAYGGRVDNVVMQVEFALKEFKRDFIADWRLLCSTNSIEEAAKAVCDRFENPKIKNYGDRIRLAYKVKAELQLGEWEHTTIPETPTESNLPSGWENMPATEYFPPRTICEGMEGKDVVLLRALLYVRELTDHVDESYFDKGLAETVKLYQKAVFPNEPKEWDGIVGNKTWAKLFER